MQRRSRFSAREERFINQIETRRRTQDERSEDTREKLLDAAIKIMMERGYAGLRSAEISHVSGVSRGGQLHHYPTKDSLVIAALERVFQDVRKRTERKIRKSYTLDQLLEAAVEDGHAFFYSPGFQVGLDILMSSGKDISMADAVRHIAVDQRAPAEEAWALKLIDAGVAPETARDIVWLLWSTLRGLAVRSFINRDRKREDRVIAYALRLARYYLSAGAKQRPARMTGSD